MPRGNMDNLTLNSELTPKERREKASKAGKASGMSRRKKRDAKEAAKIFLGLAASGQLDQYLKQLGVNEIDRTNMMGIIARHTILAQSGNDKSARLLFELSGDLSRQGGENTMNVSIDKSNSEGVVIYLPEVETLLEED